METITTTPTFAGCNAEPFGAAPVDVNGCTFVLHGQTTGSTTTTGAARTTAAMDIECPAGKSLEITAPGCTIKTGTQKGLHGITFDNEGAGTTRDVKVTFAVDKIHYTTPGGFVCALGGLAATGTDGFMTAGVTFKGYELSSPHGTANHVGITFD